MINDAPVDIELEWPRFVGRQAARHELESLVGDLEVAQVVWNDLLAPLYDAMAARLVYNRMLSCRSCGRPHPAKPHGKPRALRPHATHCPHYVGPLEHRAIKAEKALLGWHLLCSCGQTYPDEPNTVCPSAHVDWRGPRP
jgi:hypothetical protein